jgi:hypothetical protein
MYWDSFCMRAGKDGILPRSEPSDKKRSKERAVPKFLSLPNRWKTVKTGTLAYTLSRPVQCKLFIIITIRRCAADSKSAGLRPLGVRFPLPAPALECPRKHSLFPWQITGAAHDSRRPDPALSRRCTWQRETGYRTLSPQHQSIVLLPAVETPTRQLAARSTPSVLHPTKAALPRSAGPDRRAEPVIRPRLGSVPRHVPPVGDGRNSSHCRRARHAHSESRAGRRRVPRRGSGRGNRIVVGTSTAEVALYYLRGICLV